MTSKASIFYPPACTVPRYAPFQYQNVSQPKQSTAIGQQPTNCTAYTVHVSLCLVLSCHMNKAPCSQYLTGLVDMTFLQSVENPRASCASCASFAPWTLSPQILAIFTRHLRRKRACEAGRVGSGWWGCSTGGGWDGRGGQHVGWEAGQVGCVDARAEVGSG